jgi:hypothetical protein
MTTSSRRPITRTAIQNIQKQWTVFWPAPWRAEQEKDPLGQRAAPLRLIGHAMKIGFIGIGNIGAPIASQLLAAGHSLFVHDLQPEAAQALDGRTAGFGANKSSDKLRLRMGSRSANCVRDLPTRVGEPH